MLKVKADVIAGPDDVDVWLFDFGKSMMLIDGRMVSGGMWVKQGQSGRLDEVISGDHQLMRVNLKAWGCPLYLGGEAQRL